MLSLLPCLGSEVTLSSFSLFSGQETYPFPKSYLVTIKDIQDFSKSISSEHQVLVSWTRFSETNVLLLIEKISE